jgi:hypothetical protein
MVPIGHVRSAGSAPRRNRPSSRHRLRSAHRRRSSDVAACLGAGGSCRNSMRWPCWEPHGAAPTRQIGEGAGRVTPSAAITAATVPSATRLQPAELVVTSGGKTKVEGAARRRARDAENAGRRWRVRFFGGRLFSPGRVCKGVMASKEDSTTRIDGSPTGAVGVAIAAAAAGDLDWRLHFRDGTASECRSGGNRRPPSWRCPGSGGAPTSAAS